MKLQGTNQIKLGESESLKSFNILVDMDGVISYWLKKACEINDLDIKEPKLYGALKDGAFLDQLDWVDGEEVWEKINDMGTEFWSELEIFPWAKKLISEMEKLGKVYILTSPGSCATAATGKMEWMAEHFGEEWIKKTIIGKPKHLCAGPNAVLIDDSENKIVSFRENGGHAYHWPNCLKLLDGDVDADETIEDLKKTIQGYKK